MAKVVSLALIVCALIVTACGSDKEKIGVIKYLNVTEENFDATLHANGQTSNHEHIFFDSMSAMVAALQAGQIDEISTYESVATYITAHNPEMQFAIGSPVVTDVFCFAMREDKADLQEEFNGAISTMTQNGKLAKIVKKYIDNFNRAEEPSAVELPTFYGAPTIKVGVTGDLPLLDYIRADGQPAGFNTAVLAEISNLIEKNFVLVQIDSGARATALSSGQIDVIFWAVAPQSDSGNTYDFDKPEDIILTESYFADEVAHIRMKE